MKEVFINPKAAMTKEEWLLLNGELKSEEQIGQLSVTADDSALPVCLIFEDLSTKAEVAYHIEIFEKLVSLTNKKLWYLVPMEKLEDKTSGLSQEEKDLINYVEM